jgi:uncharacterized protein with PIN domain
MANKVFNPLRKYLAKKKDKDAEWVQQRCPNCNALLYEVDVESYKKDSVRIKCRLCKTIDTI